MNEPEKQDEIVRLLKELTEKTNATIESHAKGIHANREALVGLTELVNAQTRAFNILREVTIKLWEHVYGPDVPSDVPDTIN